MSYTKKGGPSKLSGFCGLDAVEPEEGSMMPGTGA